MTFFALALHLLFILKNVIKYHSSRVTFFPLALAFVYSAVIIKKKHLERTVTHGLADLRQQRHLPTLPLGSRFLRYNKRSNNREPAYVCQQGPDVQVVGVQLAALMPRLRLRFRSFFYSSLWSEN